MTRILTLQLCTFLMFISVTNHLFPYNHRGGKFLNRSQIDAHNEIVQASAQRALYTSTQRITAEQQDAAKALRRAQMPWLDDQSHNILDLLKWRKQHEQQGAHYPKIIAQALNDAKKKGTFNTEYTKSLMFGMLIAEERYHLNDPKKREEEGKKIVDEIYKRGCDMLAAEKAKKEATAKTASSAAASAASAANTSTSSSAAAAAAGSTPAVHK